MTLSNVCVSALLMILGLGTSEVGSTHNVFSLLARTGIATLRQPNTAIASLSQSDFRSQDCSGSVPTGYTRIFVADRGDGKPGTGSASDPFDGSSAEKFDTLLRGKSEGGITNLVVCIGPGTFQTEGSGDYVQGQGHVYPSHPVGFTVNKGWKIHGAEIDRTTLRLISMYTYPSNGKFLEGIVIGTYNFDSSGVEVSDITLDDNYPSLKPRYKAPMELVAVILRSNLGHQWVHNIRVMNASGEGPEDFTIGISSPTTNAANEGNLVEYVTMDHWYGGLCTAIAIAGGSGEVRHNTVTGYQIAYGGWSMLNVNFHDNTAMETGYGFNVDSLQNSKITIAFNNIVRPKLYGIVVGGNGDFTDFSIHDNTIQAGPTTVYGLVFQGNVRGSHVLRNKIVSERPNGAPNVIGLFEKNAKNINNVFQENVVASPFKNSLQGSDCLWGNVTENGQQRADLGNSTSHACVTGN
ncbi:MAG: hypothetical protein ABSC15_07970 [Terriglobales bacterium]|jgi:hypothetical protein